MIEGRCHFGCIRPSLEPSLGSAVCLRMVVTLHVNPRQRVLTAIEGRTGHYVYSMLYNQLPENQLIKGWN